MLWEEPPEMKAQKAPRNTKPQLSVKGSQEQLADAMSTLSLTGLGWKDGSKAIYDASRPVVGTGKRKARYWVYDYKEEVDRIVADR